MTVATVLSGVTNDSMTRVGSAASVSASSAIAGTRAPLSRRRWSPPHSSNALRGAVAGSKSPRATRMLSTVAAITSALRPPTSMITGAVASVAAASYSVLRDSAWWSNADLPLPAAPVTTYTPRCRSASQRATVAISACRPKNANTIGTPVSTSASESGPATTDQRGLRMNGRGSPVDVNLASVAAAGSRCLINASQRSSPRMNR